MTALLAAWGLTPLAAALLALKSRGRAGWVWFLGALDVWLSMVVLLYAASGWAREFWVMIEVALILLAIGAYWFAPSARKWPPLLTPLPKLSLRRSLAFVLGGIMVCALSSIWTAVIWEPPDKMSECSGFYLPFIAPTSPSQAVFTARDVMLFGPAPSPGDLSPNPFGNFAIARVQKQFWGPSGWNWKFLLLHRPFNWHGKDYFIEGDSPPGLVGILLPFVKSRQCGGSRMVEDAEVELRVLKDHQLHQGGQIIGQLKVYHYSRDSSPLAPGIKITLTGSAGTLVTTTDEKGVYDFPDLPPGNYSIEAGQPPRPLNMWGTCSVSLYLASEEIMQCDGYL